VARKDGAWLRGCAGAGAAFALAAVATIAQAAYQGDGPPVDRDFSAQRGPLEVSVRVGNRTVPLYQMASRQDRWYLQARKAAKYEVTVQNRSGQRVAFVLSVDGLNAINGLRSSLSPSEPMYVLDPYARATIKGWRRDLDRVNRFVFVDESRSYAERTGQGNGDLGWIRVAAFRERQSWNDWGWRQEVRREGASGKAAPAPTRDRATAPESAPMARGYEVPDEQESPGTGWGREERDHVHRVAFDPEPYATAQVILRYEYERGLVALGILPWDEPRHDRLWERENGVYGFAAPPPR